MCSGVRLAGGVVPTEDRYNVQAAIPVPGAWYTAHAQHTGF